MPASRRLGGALLVFLLLLPVLPSASAASAPEGFTLLRGNLPQATAYGAAVYDGHDVLLFGGAVPGAHTDAIVRVDPLTGLATTDLARLPQGVYAPAAVWTGSAAYVFGGGTGGYAGRLVDAIVRYDPATGAVQTMGARLPTPRDGMSAVWDGHAAYLFGGQGDGHVLRYDPATDALTVLPAVLPDVRNGIAVAFDGRDAWLFGGADANDSRYATVYRFDTATGALSRDAALLPSPRSHAGAAWIDGHAYVFGGYDGAQHLDQVVRLDPATDEAAPLALGFPDGGRDSSAVVAAGSSLFVLGGDNGALMGDVLSFTPAPQTALVTQGAPTARAVPAGGLALAAFALAGAALLLRRR